MPSLLVAFLKMFLPNSKEKDVTSFVFLAKAGILVTLGTGLHRCDKTVADVPAKVVCRMLSGSKAHWGQRTKTTRRLATYLDRIHHVVYG
jgi:hypothetical protein